MGYRPAQPAQMVAARVATLLGMGTCSQRLAGHPVVVGTQLELVVLAERAQLGAMVPVGPVEAPALRWAA